MQRAIAPISVQGRSMSYFLLSIKIDVNHGPRLRGVDNQWKSTEGKSGSSFSQFFLLLKSRKELNSINSYAAGGYFYQYKMMQKSWKMTETLTYGYSYVNSQRELSTEYQHDKV